MAPVPPRRGSLVRPVDLVFLLPGDPAVFPDPRTTDTDGLVAVGGDLSPDRLVAGYRAGIFPWFDASTPPLWWSPDPRAVIVPGREHVSRSLARHVARSTPALTWDRAFSRVMRLCGEGRETGTWITREMLRAYSAMHALGHAHSLEVWEGGELAGGIYGVQVGGLFAAESMFHRRTDGSKVALVALVRSLGALGVELVDVQFLTPHLASMGAEEWSRSRYLDALEELRDRPVDLSAAPVAFHRPG